MRPLYVNLRTTLQQRSFRISMPQILSLYAQNESTGLYCKFYKVHPPTKQQQHYAKTGRYVIVSAKSKQKVARVQQYASKQWA